LDAGSFESDGVAAFVDFGTRQCAVGGEGDEAFFARFEFWTAAY